MPPARKEKIGMKEIAEAAGVSVMTVSATLSGSGRVSEKRKREIVALAHRMGYRTNAAARLLKSKRVDDLGLLIFEKEELIREHAGFMDMTVQFMKECVRNNIHFQLEWFDSHRNAAELPQMLTNGLVGGLLIAGAPANAAKEFIDRELGLPFVTIGEPGRYSVGFDNCSQLRQAVYYLASLGHTEIGLVNGPDSLNVFRDFRQGFDSALAELSLLKPGTFHAECQPAGDFQAELEKTLDALMRSPVRPTALLVFSGLFTKAFISGLQQRGIRVPEDVSIICHETVDWEVEKFSPAITAIERKYDELIAAGVQMIRDLMDGKTVLRPHTLIVPAFSKRRTVCPPQAKG